MSKYREPDGWVCTKCPSDIVERLGTELSKCVNTDTVSVDVSRMHDAIVVSAKVGTRRRQRSFSTYYYVCDFNEYTKGEHILSDVLRRIDIMIAMHHKSGLTSSSQGASI